MIGEPRPVRRRAGVPADGADSTPPQAASPARPGASPASTGVSPARPGVSPARPGVSPAGRSPGPWKAAFFAAAALAILGIAVWALLGSSLFVVRSVAVTGPGVVPRAEVVRAAGIVPGTPLARVNTAAVARRVERINQVQSARVSRDWPGTVVIAVTGRTPALAVASPGGYTLIDKSGVAVSQVPRQPAGMVLLTSAPPVASLRGSPAVLAAATVLGQLPPQVRSLVTSVTAASPGAVTLHLSGGITVVWGGTGRAAAKAAELVILMRTKASFYDISDPATAVTGGL
jgi:cell division protein FtsQ